MTINTELLQQTLDYIEAHPEEWDQNSWISECGTVACFAGHAVWLSGYTINSYSTVRGRGISSVSVDYAATLLLGLDGNQADVLFHGNNDLDDLRLIVKTLVDTGLTPKQLEAREIERAEPL